MGETLGFNNGQSNTGAIAFEIISAELPDIATMRNDYLGSLPEFQELYLELMVPGADFYTIGSNTQIIGYVIISDRVLIEFYLIGKFIPYCPEIFKQIIKRLSGGSIYCKSFDSLLLNCCLVQSLHYKLIGEHYRDFYITDIAISKNLNYRMAIEEDIPFLLKQEDGLYETPDELNMFTRGQNISMFYNGAEFIGCGFLIKVHPGWDYYDIGMWVHPSFRNKGYATQIISVLKGICLNNNWKPVCGCDINNIASQKTLEKCGFFSKHKLIEFLIPLL